MEVEVGDWGRGCVCGVGMVLEPISYPYQGTVCTKFLSP